MPLREINPLSPDKLVKIINSEELGASLHDAASRGDKKKLRKIIKSGISVDFPNNVGQTPLYCACFDGHYGAVDVLLEAGADPNRRSNEGCTPVHAAGYSCSPKLLSKLIEFGGDLRYHDSKGRTVKEWITCQADPKKRRRMMEYLEKARMVAMTNSCRDLLLDRQPSNYYNSAKNTGTGPSLINLFRIRSHQKSLSMSPSVHSSGFGKIYFGNKEHVGTMASIPLVAEAALRHDEFGYTFNNGPFMVMESMHWNKVPVTVKRLHRDPPEGGNVDLLIRENEFMSRLRHPNILLMMGVCQTNNMEGLVLLYERISCGSLYSYLYQKVETLDTLAMCQVMKQIAEALLYLHQESLLHCCITSHAVQMVLPNFAKLGNFEYMIESGSTADPGIPRSNVIDNKYLNAAYNWLAPEVLAGKPPTEKGDLYSLCAVLWEILHGMPPWSGMHAHEIQTEVCDSRSMLEIKESVKNPFSALLQYGLALEPKGRQMTVEQFRDILGQVLVDHNTMGIKGDTPHPQRPNKKQYVASKSLQLTQQTVSSADEGSLERRKKKRPGTSTSRRSESPYRSRQDETDFKKAAPKCETSSSSSSDQENDNEGPIMPVTTCEINSAPKPKGPSPPKPKHLPPANNPPKPEHLPQPEYLPKSDEEQTEVKKPSPQRDEKNEVDSGFSLITKTSKDYIKDPRKRAFFTSSSAANSWSKPTSTSTPTNTSPAVKAVTLDHSDTLKNETKTEDKVESPEVKRANSPENPFRRDYQRFRTDDLMSTVFSTASFTVDKQTSTFSSSVVSKGVGTETTSAFQPISASVTSRTFAPPVVTKKTTTVYGSLLGPQHVIKSPKANSTLKDNYFITHDHSPEPEEEKATTAGPVYLARGSSASLPGYRHSYAEGYAVPVGKHISSVSTQGLRNVIGNRHSWAVENNQAVKPGCFKPASHSAGGRFTKNPGNTGAGTVAAIANYTVPGRATSPKVPTSPGSPKSMYQKLGPTAAHASGRKQTRFTMVPDVIDGQRVIKVESDIQPSHAPMCRSPSPYPTRSPSPYPASSPQPEEPQKVSPRAQKKEWFGGGGSIGDLISTYQTQSDEHQKKQAVLVMKSLMKGQPGEPEFESRQIVQKTMTRKLEKPLEIKKDEVLRRTAVSTSQPQVSTKKVYLAGKSSGGQGSSMSRSSEFTSTPRFRSTCDNMQVSCPAQQTPDKARRDSDESTTDQEVYKVVDDALYRGYSEVLSEHVHPNCVHKTDSLARAKGLSLTNVNVNNNCSASGPHGSDTYLAGDGYSVDACEGLAFPSEVRGAPSYSSVCSKNSSSCLLPTATSSQFITTASQTESSTKLDDVEDLTMISDMIETRRDEDIEEFYCDDILGPDLLKEKHMRLQNTLPLDPPSFGESFARSYASPRDQLISPRDKTSSFDTFLSITPVDDNLSSSHRKGRRGNRMFNTSKSPRPELEVVEVKKKVYPGPTSEGYSTMLEVESDRNGNHHITGTTTNLATGHTTRDYQKDIHAAKVITSIVMEEDEMLV